MDYQELISQHPRLFANEDAIFKIITEPQRIVAWKEETRQKLKQKGLPVAWAEIGLLFNDPYFIILRDLVEFPDGRLGGYARLINQADLEGGQGVVVLPALDEKILIQYNYRHPTRSWHWEVPRGFGEPGVSAEEQAHVEIREETGGKIQQIVDLGSYHNNTGMEGVTTRLFFAQLISVGEPSKAEGIEKFKWVTIEEFETLIRDGEITDGFTIAAYTRAKLRGLI